MLLESKIDRFQVFVPQSSRCTVQRMCQGIEVCDYFDSTTLLHVHLTSYSELSGLSAGSGWRSFPTPLPRPNTCCNTADSSFVLHGNGFIQNMSAPTFMNADSMSLVDNPQIRDFTPRKRMARTVSVPSSCWSIIMTR